MLFRCSAAPVATPTGDVTSPGLDVDLNIKATSGVSKGETLRRSQVLELMEALHAKC